MRLRAVREYLQSSLLPYLPGCLTQTTKREIRYLNVIDRLGEKIDQKVDNLGTRVGCLEKDVADIKEVTVTAKKIRG